MLREATGVAGRTVRVHPVELALALYGCAGCILGRELDWGPELWARMGPVPVFFLLALALRVFGGRGPWRRVYRVCWTPLVPLTLLYLGIDETQKYTIIFLGTFFQLVLMVCDTVSGVDANLINAAKTLGAGKLQVYKEVIFPAALPGLMDDFRLTIGWAWTYLVVAEMVAAQNGLGYMILRSQRYLATDTIFAGLILIGLIGLVTDFLFRILTRLVAPWHERLADR